jgi:23S rRNA-/tRNA-specific pseudouridylate synthase
MEKIYLAVTSQQPKQSNWTCRLSIDRDPKQIGRMIAHQRGKEAETSFRLVASHAGKFLIEARPYTGRTHQIRVHLAESGCPVSGDEMYGRGEEAPMGLRAVGLSYRDPFTKRPTAIRAPVKDFLRAYGFESAEYEINFSPAA